jgi:hypothetical protein
MERQMRARARLFGRGIVIILILLLFALTVEVAAVVRHGGSPLAMIYRLPMLFYLAAIWMVRDAALTIARGGMFDAVVPRLLSRVGVALALGATINVFVGPWIRLIARGRGPYAYYDVAAITLGVVGLALILLARLLAEAVAMRAELDEIL